MSSSSLRWIVPLAAVLIGGVAWFLLRPAPPPKELPTTAPLAGGQATQQTAGGHLGSPNTAPLPALSNPGAAYSFLPITPLPPPEGQVRCGNDCFCGVMADDPCGSRRVCGKGACSDGLGKQGWRVRLGGLKLESASEPDEETRVCVKIHGQREEACASLKESRKPTCAGGARLAATTTQLLEDGLDITIRSADGEELASAKGASYKFMTAREMCAGFQFGAGKFTGKKRVSRVWFYLDD